MSKITCFTTSLTPLSSVLKKGLRLTPSAQARYRDCIRSAASSFTRIHNDRDGSHNLAEPAFAMLKDTRIRIDVTLVSSCPHLPAAYQRFNPRISFVSVMRVTIYTEIEPPGNHLASLFHFAVESHLLLEQRPCPPLPLDGPILLQVLFAASAAVPASSAAVSAGSGAGDIVIPVAHPHSSEVSAVHPPSVSPGLTLRDLTALLLRTWLVVCLVGIIWTLTAYGIELSGRNGRDVPASVTCPAWQGSDPLCSASCPRPYPGSSLPPYGPYSCPTDARRGDVDSMARGLARTSSALDVKRVHIKMCRLSARRGLAACLIMGYLNRSIMSLVMGYLIMGIIKTKLNHPFEGTINMKSSLCM
ncbi:hypothetical protein DFH06DRAFT_1301476, partial [Mycena polygramma]